MAGENTLGKLVVRLLMEKDDFKKGTKEAEVEIADLGKNLSAFADSINSKVVGAFQAAAAAAAAFAASSAVLGANFESAIMRVAAIAADGSENVQALTDQARKLGKSTAFTATEAAQAMRELAQAGLKSADIIAASEAAVRLAGATGATMEQSTSLIAATMSQFQLAAQDSTRVVDVFSRAMNSTLFDMSSLTEAMKYAGTVGAGFGYSLEKTTAAVAMFRNLGLEGSLAGTAFKMALSAASNVTDKGEKILRKYGLTARDVNPALHDFADIMKTVGEAGLTTADAMQVFGTRAGANVAVIAEQFANGSTKFNEVLTALEDSAGSTETMYATMMDTVLGRFQIVASAAQELALTLFDTYAAPLKDLLDAVGEAISYVADEFRTTSGEVSSGFAGILGGMTEWVRENRAGMAVFFREAVALGQRLISLLASVAPYLDDVARLMVALFAAQKIYAFVAGVQSAITAVRALVVVLGEAAAAGTLATGGLLPIAAAIAAAVVALASLTSAQDTAAESARRLADAEATVSEEVRRQRETYETEVGKILSVQQDRIRATITERQAAGDLSDEELRRLEGLLRLTQAQAASKLLAGEMIQVNGELLDVETAIQERGNEGVELVKKRVTALNEAANQQEARQRRLLQVEEDYNAAVEAGFDADRAAQTSLAGYGKTIEDVRAQLDAAKTAAAGYSEAAKRLADQSTVIQARILQQEAADLKRGIAERDKTLSDAQQRELDARQKAADKTAALERELTGALASAGKDRTEDVREELRKRIESINKTIDAEIKLYAAGSARVASLEEHRAAMIEVARQAVAAKRRADTEEELRREQEAYRVAGLDEAMTAADAADQRLAEIRQMFAAELSLHEAGSAAALDVAARQARAEAMIRDAFLAQMRDRETEATRARLDVIEGLERARLGKIAQIEAERAQQLRELTLATAEERARVNAVFDARVLAVRTAASQKARDLLRGELTEAEQLQRERLATMADLEGASGREIARVNRKYDRQIFAAKVREATAAFKKIASLGVAAARAVAGAFGSVASAIGSATGAAAGLVTTLTGLSVDVLGMVQDLVDAQGAASESGTTFDPATAAQDAVTALLTGAQALLPMLLATLPTILAGLADGIPGLVAEVAAALPVLVQELADQVPTIIDAVVASVPVLLDALVESVPIIIDALRDAVPRLIDAVTTALPLVVRALVALLPEVVSLLSDALRQVVAALPGLLSEILSALPSIIEPLLAAIPDVLDAVLAAIPRILSAVIDALPEIVQALLDGVLGILVRLVEALPLLVAEVIELVPDLIGAVLDMLPGIITSLIAAVPDLVMALISHLPELISALIMLVPQVVVAVVAALPQITSALVSGIVTELIPALPQIAGSLVAALIQGIGDAFQQLAKMFGDLFREALGFVGDLFRKDKNGDGLFKRVADGVSTAIKGLWDGAGGWALDGINYVPATMRVTLHPGEAVVPASRNPAGPGRSGHMLPPPPPSSGRQATQPLRADLTVVLDSRVVDYATVTAMDRGHAPRLERRLRKVSGIVKGFDRGKFSSRS